MKKLFFLLTLASVLFACKKEKDHHHDHDTSDTTAPVLTIDSPLESNVYHNGDTVFITGNVTDNELHGGTLILKNDTTLTEYLNQYHNVHDLTSATINYFYVVSGITQNEAVTFTATYEDHKPNLTTITRHLVFMP